TVDEACFAREDARVAEALCEQRGSLDAGEQAEREVARVPASELPELLLRPLDDKPEQRFGLAFEVAGAFPDLGAEAAERAAQPGDDLAHRVPLLGERLQSCLRRPLQPERVQGLTDLGGAAFEHGAD